jgi:hypothetical protein
VFEVNDVRLLILDIRTHHKADEVHREIAALEKEIKDNKITLQMATISKQDADRVLQLKKEVLSQRKAIKEMQEASPYHDVFLSHKQSSGAYLANLLEHLLHDIDPKLKIWLDIHCLTDIHDLKHSVYKSINYVFIITDQIEQSEYVQKEAQFALESKCKIITVFDSKSQFPNVNKVDPPIQDILKIGAVTFYNAMDKQCAELIYKRLQFFPKDIEP